MLVDFKVQGFKNFKDEIELNLGDVRNYAFNEECVNNNVIRTGILYGPNSSGKSNLGEAIFDIVIHLTDKNKSLNLYNPYCNLDSKTGIVNFYYKFKFKNNIVEYIYCKEDVEALLEEKLMINGEEIINYDFKKKEGFVNLKGTEDLNKELYDGNISFLKYIYKNTNLDRRNTNNLLFVTFFDFVERMLFFRSLKDKAYIGFTNSGSNFIEGIIKKDKVADFAKFLAKNGVNYQLTVDALKKNILCKFANASVPFMDVASSGTIVLALYYFWYMQLEQASFVFIDEFDAFYHYQVSRNTVKELRTINEAQFFLTTHNTDIMSNDLLRPDCYFILHDGKITSLCNATNKELRYAHNLQKMYKGGAFEEAKQ